MHPSFNSFLRRSVQEILQTETTQLGHSRAEIEDLRNTLATAQARLKTVENQCLRLKKAAEWAGFNAQMTVHEAWAAHPDAQRVFARFHLPACDQCPVGADERLEEAAFGYAIDLGALLKELNTLV
jgi:hypothetical protein